MCIPIHGSIGHTSLGEGGYNSGGLGLSAPFPNRLPGIFLRNQHRNFTWQFNALFCQGAGKRPVTDYQDMNSHGVDLGKSVVQLRIAGERFTGMSVLSEMLIATKWLFTPYV